MFSLIIDSSSPQGIVALLDNQKIIMSEVVPFGVRESGDLVQTLGELLSQAGLKTNQLKQIVLGIGPGSFTGLRVGASVAKALAYVHNLPIIGISSLRIFDPLLEGPFVVLLDAKLHGFCIQKGEKRSGKVIYEPLAQKISLNQLENEIGSIPLWITADQASLEKKLKSTMDLERLVQYAPCPLQMFNEATKVPQDEAKEALEPLDLKYFDRPN